MPAAVSLLQQRALLRREYEFEKEAHRRETATMGVGRKVKRGDCWFPAFAGRSYYNSLGRLVVEITRTDDTDIEHNFEPGRPLCFFVQDATGGLTYLPFAATVSYAEADRMVVELPDTAALATVERAERLGVQLSFDETTYRLMFAALDTVIAAKGDRTARLRDIIHGTLRPEKGPVAPVRLPWLNATQERAVNEVLQARDIAVVHGPPGTGKTTTLVETVYEVLRRESQVLVCAQSNMAVDWIAEKLVDRGVAVLRMGNPARVNDKMFSFTYERRFENHPDYPQLWAVRRSIRQLYAAPRRERSESFHQKVSRLRDRAAELEYRIRESLFAETRVFACTLTGAAGPLLAGMRFHTLFIDEAAQALEAACWMAMTRADRVVLAGDHKQLPPTIKCVDAARGGLSRTLMEQVADARPETVTLLNVQYRMNEALMHFSSDWFYGGRVESAPEVRHRGILDYDTPLTWIDSNPDAETGGEEFVGESYGRINRPEATQTVEALKAYIARIGRERLLDERIDFGIISPYKAQVQLLRSLIRREAVLKPFRGLITVNTVDGFQGQERDVVLISLVRANEKREIGFLSDLRRMNVAMTRARMKLFILGDPATLSHYAFYRKLHRYACELART